VGVLHPPSAHAESAADDFAATLTQRGGPTDVRPRPAPLPGTRLGRFTLLDMLGNGAMGVVFAAYDEVLDRKIAVKLLRGGGGDGEQRLLREAQAMARVDHPNVATVHDVGVADDQVYVDMEFVRGTTLAVWQRTPARTWEEVLAAYVQAGRGLAAAHAAGLVHRDFKPSNAMIGEDGRVRVLDFGLVRAAGLPGADGSGSHRRVEPRLTQDGEVVGTPAYMAPEQIRGLAIGPAADQFSFCASLYEALFGQLPFAGDSLGALFAAIARGRVQEVPRASRVPMWLRAAVQRGLASAPEARHPSMEALLRALDRGAARRRGRLGLGLGLAAAFAGFMVAKSQAAPVCDGAAAELAGAWSEPQRAAVAAALRAAGPAFADEVWPRVAGALDGYAERWAAAYRDACLAHLRGEQSGLMLDRRMACLEQRRAALAAAARVLADGGVAIEALRVAHDLPGLGRCSDLAALADAVPPPGDPEVAARVVEVERGLARAEALARAGRFDAAIAQVEREVEAAAATGHRPAHAEALLVRGRLRTSRELVDTQATADGLGEAVLVALAARDDEAAAEAAALRVYALGQHRTGGDEALKVAALARALVERLPAPDRVRGLLENNTGTVYLARGDVDRARAAFAAALALRERAGDTLDLANTHANLALVDPDPASREDHLRRAVDTAQGVLGPGHPLTVELRLIAGRYLRDPHAAAELLVPGCEALLRFAPDDLAQRARCLADLAHLRGEVGDRDAAAAAWRDTDALLRRLGDDAPLSAVDRLLLRGHAAAAAGGADAPLHELAVAIAELGRETDWWARRDRAELQLALGLDLRALGRDGEARDVLAGAVADFEAVEHQARDSLGQQRLARARVELAELDLAGGRPAEM
jgi:tetratricopeptide (TPR) repeat protein